MTTQTKVREDAYSYAEAREIVRLVSLTLDDLYEKTHESESTLPLALRVRSASSFLDQILNDE